MRNLSLLLAVTQFLACGKIVVDQQPNQQPAGAPSKAPAGRAAPPTEPVIGGSGGSSPIAPPVREAGAPPRTDASTAPPPVTAADGGSEDDAGSAREPLCDGSEALRLAFFVREGGLADRIADFTNPRGHDFLGVDGKCRYFVEGNYMHGIFSGTLTPAEAEQLSADLHWNELDSWAHYGLVLDEDAPCSEGGVVGLMKAKASAGCTCGCDPAAPSGLGEAISGAFDWLRKLQSTGKPLEGPVSALILANSSSKPGQPEFEWPLARPFDAIPNLFLDKWDPRFYMDKGPWARFEDAADCTKLREMRSLTTIAATDAYWARVVLLRDDDKLYDLYVRDELPAETARAWKELQATVPR